MGAVCPQVLLGDAINTGCLWSPKAQYVSIGQGRAHYAQIQWC